MHGLVRKSSPPCTARPAVQGSTAAKARSAAAKPSRRPSKRQSTPDEDYGDGYNDDYDYGGPGRFGTPHSGTALWCSSQLASP